MSGAAIGIVVLVCALVALLVAADRTRVIAVCAVERGKLRVTRGRLSPRVLLELRDIASRRRIVRATIIVRKEDGAPTLRLTGVDDAGTAQQLRNAIGRFKLAELR